MATQAERQKAYRERKRAKGQKDRLYFATDDQDRTIREYLDTGILPTGIPPETVAARDRMAAIRERLERAERRYREVQDLVILLAKRALVLLRVSVIRHWRRLWKLFPTMY